MIGINRENEKPFDGTDEVVPFIQIRPLAVPPPPLDYNDGANLPAPLPRHRIPSLARRIPPPRCRRRRSVKTKNHVKAPTNSSHRQYKPMNSKVAS